MRAFFNRLLERLTGPFPEEVVIPQIHTVRRDPPPPAVLPEPAVMAPEPAAEPPAAVETTEAVEGSAFVLEAAPATEPPPPAEPEPEPVPVEEPIAVQDDGPGEVVKGVFVHDAGTRDYQLYLPPGWADESLPLVVMLHGCQQNAADFARGTGMDALAHEARVLVLYPEQSQHASPARCWNWFSPQHQARDGGEPALIAALVAQIVTAHRVDPARIYVAGLSAGGAMAAVMAHTHPDLFAAIGVHSGLAFGVATDVMAALGAMRRGPSASQAVRAPGLPTIVFHGDEDSTVHPSNGEQVAALGPDGGEVQRAQARGGRGYTRRYRPGTEHWLVHGAGHAWSGGHPDGSYTDPAGPDASAEMLRFFLAHPKRVID